MIWMAVAQIGMSMMAGAAKRGAERAQNTIADAEAAAANTIREGKNEQRAAEGTLARFMQNENNNRRLRAAGQQLAAGQQTLQRMRDSNVTASVEQQLQEAEALGAQAAHGAQMGTAGNAVDMIDIATRLRQSRIQQNKKQQQGYVDYDTIQQIAGVMPQAIQGLDASVIQDGLDYSVNQSQAKPITGNAIFDALSSPGMAGLVGSFSGTPTPQGGSPAQGMTMGSSGEGFKPPRSSFGFNPGASSSSIRLYN